MSRGRSVAEARILVKAEPARVLDAFRSDVDLRRWYFEDASLELRPGGRFSFLGIEGRVEATVVDVRPDGFEFEYEPPWWGRVVVDVHAEERGTRVRVRHAGFEGREEWIHRFTWSWEAHLRNLKAHLEGRAVK